MKNQRVLASVIVSWFVLSAGPAAAQYTAARLKSGSAPAPSPNAVGWIWDASAVNVDASGRPGAGGGLVGSAVSGWSFEPARDENGSIESQVLIVACYRPASLETGPENQAPGFSTPSEVPAATTAVPPVYPPRALGDGVVIVELSVDSSGAVSDARVVRSAGGFDGAALDAARRWRFRPAQRGGSAVPAFVYLIFGFRQPVTE